MEERDKYIDSQPASQKDIDSDSSIHTDEESARLDFAEIFSNKFSNIFPLYSSSHGATEIHSATRYGKRFALKGLKREYADDPVHAICMAKEFEIGITLDHPNIRRTLGLEQVERLGKRLILEYVDSLPLSEMLSEGELTLATGSEIAKQIADAMKYLHSKQIIHRDLKPDNILISHQGGNVKVIDFNLSDRDDYIVLKQPAGSKRYMAPELSDPDTTPTEEADLYSLGVIMKELADASGNHRLEMAARGFMNPDPAKRRMGIDILEKEGEMISSEGWSNRMLESKTLTYILSAICVLISTFIILHYINQ